MSDNILSLVGASKRFGDLTVLDNVTIGIDRGEKVGLIGPNGTGKSTLMRLIAGAGTVVGPTPERTEVLDEGTVAIRNDARLFFLEQEPRFPDDATPRELLLACITPLRAAIARYEELVVKGDSRADAVLEEIERLGGWDYEHRLERAASEVGLPLDRTVAGMSGGEKKRVALAQMLVSGADFWLLDEPTNHLDAETTEWLEETLSGSSKTVLLVTHDRYFLDRVADRMLSLRRGEMKAYDGNYSDYLEARAIEDALEGRARDRRERLFLAELDWARRMPKARTTKSRFRMDRVGELEASLKIVPDRAAIGFSFGDPPRLGKTILETVSIFKAYGERDLIHGLSLTLRRGERIGIVGRNGCGKSTLLRMMAGDIAPDRGTVTRGSNTEIAWLDQYRLRHLDLTKTVRATVVPEGGDTVFFGEEKIHVASWLDRFGFPSKTHLMKVASLSGGERNRLAIARFLLEKANLLLLDEPTNDLDLDTLNLLEAALVEFPGCVIVVTHDRYFLDKVS
ncbi:MAG: ABC-F family ATP-binding cassette domain-containing protein, partial [Myxococcales bacterium]|nr:ABC-F family ATP-binding cassette domain-containing protein [Myxococcales bacterium]